MRAHFIHGWAMAPSIWTELTERLPELEASFADRGYFGGEGAPAPDEPALWITHSLGTMLALRDLPETCIGLVAINGFDRFASGDGIAGIAPRVLDRMLSRLEGEVEPIVREFHRSCGAAEHPGEPLREPLRADLELLRNGDFRQISTALTVPVLSLQGAEDPILPADMRARTLRKTPDFRAFEHASAGHLLPLQAPDWCAEQLRNFLAEIA